MEQGNLAEAESLARQATAMEKEWKGGQQPNHTGSPNSLSSILLKRGKLAEAETLLCEELDAVKKSFSEEHPNVATALNHLGALRMAQGKFIEAEALFTQALAMSKRIFGGVNLEVVAKLTNLAAALAEQNRLSEAESMTWEALEITKSRLIAERQRKFLSIIHYYADPNTCPCGAARSRAFARNGSISKTGCCVAQIFHDPAFALLHRVHLRRRTGDRPRGQPLRGELSRRGHHRQDHA
ncbi:MAG: tetratricopeptide repeat protein [Pedosphaera sp.]|nr:tetratricopeptide repeat protein [Pedosphaera sp.]